MAQSSTKTTITTTTIAPIDPITHQPRQKSPSNREILTAALKGRIPSRQKLYKQKKELESPPHLTDEELIDRQHVVVGKLASALIGGTFCSVGGILLPHFLFSATLNIFHIFHYQSQIQAVRAEAIKRELKLDNLRALLPRILACVTVRIILLTATVGVSEFTVLGDGTGLVEHMGHLQDTAMTYFQSITLDTLPATADPHAWQVAAQNLQTAYMSAHGSVLQQIGHLINAPSQVVNVPVDDLVSHLTDGAAGPGAVPTWGVADGSTNVNALSLHTIGEDMVSDGLASSVRQGMADAFVELNTTAVSVDMLVDRITDEPAEKIAEKLDRRSKVSEIQHMDKQKV